MKATVNTPHTQAGNLCVGWQYHRNKKGSLRRTTTKTEQQKRTFQRLNNGAWWATNLTSVPFGCTMNSREVSRTATVWQMTCRGFILMEVSRITAGWELETSGWGSCHQTSRGGSHQSISALGRSGSSREGHHVLYARDAGSQWGASRQGHSSDRPQPQPPREDFQIEAAFSFLLSRASGKPFRKDREKPTSPTSLFHSCFCKCGAPGKEGTWFYSKELKDFGGTYSGPWFSGLPFLSEPRHSLERTKNDSLEYLSKTLNYVNTTLKMNKLVT